MNTRYATKAIQMAAMAVLATGCSSGMGPDVDQPELPGAPGVEVEVDRIEGELTFAPVSSDRIVIKSPISLSNGTITIQGTSGNDVATVKPYGIGQVQVTLNAWKSTFSASSVTGIVFEGGAGNDDLTCTVSTPMTANGGDGDDVLRGCSGPDFLVGGYGQDTIYGNGGADTIWGSGGSDFLYGGDGDDHVRGHGGNDTMYGGNGRDWMDGGSGNDKLYGESGQDLLVTVGNGVDTITGGYQWDNVWMDTADTMTDPSSNELSLGYVHDIASFDPISYSGGLTSTPIGLDPVGEDLPDPLPHFDGTSQSLVDYSAQPLFAAAGPTKDDIFQGDTGDCYFLAPMSALADHSQEFIRKMVVDLGDGSYAVRFHRDGAEHYVRVDADLWTTGGAPRYADLGQDGSLWVPIVEKAYAVFRKQQGTYASIASGNGTLDEHLNVGKDSWEVDDGVDPQDVVDWFAAGKPKGTISLKVNAGALATLSWLKAQRDAGKAVYTGARSGISNTTAIKLDDPSTSGNESTYRRGQHIYMVDHVTTDANGNPTALVLRDPYGSYRTISDFVRIYFCIGRGVIYLP